MVTESKVAENWSLVQRDQDAILYKIAAFAPDQANFGTLGLDEIRIVAKRTYDGYVPKIQKELCDTKLIKELSETSAKDFIIPLATALGDGKSTALLVLIATLAVKLALQGFCGRELSLT